MRNPIGVTVLTVVSISCGGVSGPAMPRLIPGGGIGDGAIDGHLYVHVTDDDTRAVVGSATVRIGASADPSPCEVATDSTGLATFEPDGCPDLKGPVTVDRVGDGLRAHHLDRRQRHQLDDPDSLEGAPGDRNGDRHGYIAGWADLPAPAANHQTLALIGASQAPDLGDRANDIPQGMRDVLVAGLVTTSVAANICVPQRAGRRLRLAADDPHRAAGSLRDHRRSGHQGDRRRGRRHDHRARVGDQDRAHVRGQRHRGRRDADHDR